jgi:hypothetical protein
MQAITDALGPYQPPGQAATAPSALSYTRPQRTGPLCEAFKQERDAAVAARKAALAKLHQQHVAYAQRIITYYRERFRQERSTGLRGFLRRDSFEHIADQQRKDRTDRVRREAKERREVRARHPIPTWQGYLESEAAKGNEAALTALRGRMQRRAQLEAQLLRAQDAGEARHIVYQHLRPAVRRDGRVIYRVADGGVVSDEARNVRVNEVTAGAAVLALSLAADRFGRRPLVVQGTSAFRTQVAMLAGVEGFNVTFADGALERQRASARRDRANVVARDHGGARSLYDKTDTRNERDHGR